MSEPPRSLPATTTTKQPQTSPPRSTPFKAEAALVKSRKQENAYGTAILRVCAAHNVAASGEDLVNLIGAIEATGLTLADVEFASRHLIGSVDLRDRIRRTPATRFPICAADFTEVAQARPRPGRAYTAADVERLVDRFSPGLSPLQVAAFFPLTHYAADGTPRHTYAPNRQDQPRPATQD